MNQAVYPKPGGLAARPGQDLAPSRQAVLAELCRRLVLDTHAPAAVLVNYRLECLFSLGPADRYLRVAPGGATHELLAMAHDDIRTKLRSAIQQAIKANARTIVTGGRTNHDGRPISFRIDIQPVTSEGEALLLICFVNETVPGAGEGPSGQKRGAGRRSPRSNRNSKPREPSFRAPSERWKYRATSSGQSTKKHYPCRRSFSRRTKSC